MTRLSIWLKDHLYNNIKNNLDSTLDVLLKLSPPFRKNTSMIEQKEALKSSIHAFFKNSEENMTKYRTLYMWVKEAASNKKELKIIDKKHHAAFQRARFFSKQGAYIEPILEHMELSLFRFIIKQEKYIPYETVRNFVSKCNPPKKDDFSDTDLLCLLNFITILLIIEDQDALKPLREIKQKLESELIKRWISTRKRRHEEDDNKCNVKKRDLKNIEYRELTDFTLNVISKLEKNEEQVGKIVRLAIAKDETLINIWKSLMTQKDEYVKIKKFVTLANFQFDMVSTPDITFQMPVYMTNLAISYLQDLKIKEAET
ncbi:16947_t:CDS:2 [Cetraspora pellucida]|uniref:16947_t:CDS:1 n=1 Tax=Cetraspora pellucida TaxID=1433469 RepID=A0A9N9GUT3_9GLOM|nr:16947_t:CDS:2 [Cetraspora pellucida]